MRRIIKTLSLLFVCIMALSGCNNKNNDNGNSTKEPNSTEVTATATIVTKETEQPIKETESNTTKEPEKQELKKEEQDKKNDTKEGYKVVLKKGEVSKDGKFKVTYPQIEGWSDEKAMKEWNHLFESANYGKEDDGVDAYTLKTTVMTESSELLSILMEGSIQYEGIDEVSHFAYTYNINMKTGENYRLKDSKANLSEIEDKLMNESYHITTANKNVSMVAVLDCLYLMNEKEDDVARVQEALKECDYDEDNANPACYSYWKNGKVSLIFAVDEEIGGYTIFTMK